MNTNWIIPLFIALLTVQYSSSSMCFQSGVTFYSRETLLDIGHNMGPRPGITNTFLKCLQKHGISRIRPRGCRGGREARHSKNSTLMFTNNSLECNQNISVIVTQNRAVGGSFGRHSSANLINIPLSKDYYSDNDRQLRLCLLNVRSVCNKAIDVCEYITDNDIDIFLMTETWLSKDTKSNQVILGDLVPHGYKIIHIPRPRRRGGGVGVIFRDTLNLQLQKSTSYSSFENIEALLKTGNDCIRLVVLYRPPSSSKCSQPVSTFLQEFEDYIDSQATTTGRLLVCGDFNFHYENVMNQDALKFRDLLFSLALHQHVTLATHTHGHVLDLVITRVSDEQDGLVQSMDIDGAILSDHAPILFSVPFRKPAPKRKQVSIRKIKDIDMTAFLEDLQQSSLCTCPSDDITKLVEQYNTTITTALDTHAPALLKTITIKPQSPWYTEAIREAKRVRRQAERRWRKTRLAVHLELYQEECHRVCRLCKQAKQDYYCLKIEVCGNDQKKVFSIAKDLMNNKKDIILPSISDSKSLAEIFADFFKDKIDKIRQSFDYANVEDEASNSDTQSIPKLTVLNPTSAEELRKVILSGNSKTCHLDPLPTQLLKSSLDVLLPVLVRIVNTSLSSAHMPSSLKSATVTPLLKKPTLNHEDLKNYRPVSSLPYISKLIEKIVVHRLNEHMTKHHLHEYYQSAYRMFHSTETALLRVHNDICQAIDKKRCVYLVLLDLSAAFDTVEHSVLLGRFQESLGITSSALDWCDSYFLDRCQCVNILGNSSIPRPLSSGMPQGSVMGPFGFPSYTGPVGRICEKHGIAYHFYADDTQLYLPFHPKDKDEARHQLEGCIREIRDWMRRNFLKLNDEKTEFLVMGSSHQLQQLTNTAIWIGDETVTASSSARNIGAIFDDKVSMKEHVQYICKSCYYHLRNIGKVRHCLTQGATETLVHAFIASKLDHMNGLLSGIPDCLLGRLQRIQNNAARIVTKSKRRDHITPVLMRLHWLPVEKRVQYKILLTTFKALHGLAPGYVCDLIRPYQPPRALRSLDLHLLHQPRSRTKTYGDRSFMVCSPYLWNKMPLHLRQQHELESFKTDLKTFLYRQAYPADQ